MSEVSDFFPSTHDISRLLAVQGVVAGMAVSMDDFGKLRLIGGVDQAFVGDCVISGVVVLRCGSLEVVERVYAVQPVVFPYIPTFLGFREGPAIVSAYKRLESVPDVLLVDGAGLNHPRSAGLATHIGVVLDVPTIGITKKILCGLGEEPAGVGEANPLVHKGERVGWLLKSARRSRPIVVAPGHRVSLETSLRIVKGCLSGHKLPEPVRLAHLYVKELSRKFR